MPIGAIFGTSSQYAAYVNNTQRNYLGTSVQTGQYGLSHPDRTDYYGVKDKNCHNGFDILA